MNSIETLATFFGWCAVINIGVIVLFLVFLTVFHEFVGKLSAKMFGVTKEEAKTTFFRIFLQYRLAFVLLNLVPYVALKIMA
jgi:hypothetical protein